MRFASSQRLQQVQQPMIPVVGQWIAQHPGTISLGQGIVHYRPPDSVRKAVVDAMASGPQVDRYGLVKGINLLLQRIREKLNNENGIRVESDRTIVVTAGSNMGFVNAVLAICEVGDEVVLLSPYYFNHEMAIDMVGCKSIIVPTDSNYQIDLQAIEDALTPRTRAVVTISPNNPTGAVYGADALADVNRLCRERGVFHISDEAYEYFVYGSEKHFSAGSLAGSQEHTISLFSLSKAYGMAGWRIGYMVIPQQLETAVKKIQDTNLVCPPMASQMAAAAALQSGRSWCDDQIRGFGQVRDLVLDHLQQLGDRCRVPRPEGAFYVLIQLDTHRTDLQLVEDLIRQHGVAVMPGCTFGANEPCSLRIAYGALDAETVAAGMSRLTGGLSRLL